ncbi:putative calcium-transporting ATPase 13, plasma membrane-type [Camellia lanceoleosa]|uniref:Calcium-transporting ATPase 13, plasma membrane-type n=1 Tax=Camellia lanceoleosa TaxID=1840588 RepID=A0ACC0ICH0_9ERIC|nr:putative calcium-transporting ATPase 13, plasma membrane-type [Camellia lanceoleosa]
MVVGEPEDHLPALNIDQKTLADMIKEKNSDQLHQFGRVKGMAVILETDEKDSMNGNDAHLIHRKAIFGSNRYHQGKVQLHTEDLNSGAVVEGKDFRNFSDQERTEKVETISVMARSSPFDKLLMVQCLKQKGHVVAVTSDGTNDGPALKEADIELSMGSKEQKWLKRARI